eukprot:820674-Rhodomonas_salina.1
MRAVQPRRGVDREREHGQDSAAVGGGEAGALRSRPPRPRRRHLRAGLEHGRQGDRERRRREGPSPEAMGCSE